MLSGRGFTRVVGLTAAGTALSCCIVAAWTVVAVEDGIRGSYASALKQRGMVAAATEPVSSDVDVPRSKPGRVPIARSEDFWLGHATHGAATPVALTEPVSVGDTLTISLNGKSQSFRVTGVETHSAAASRDGSASNPEMVEITGRLDSEPKTTLRVQIDVDLGSRKVAKGSAREL